MILNDIAIESDHFEKVDKLIIILHGYGNCGSDYINAINTFLRQEIGNAIFLLPDAPNPCETWSGRQWFPLSLKNMNLNEIRHGLEEAAPTLCNYIKSKVLKYGCKNIHLIGISQGACMALEMIYHVNITKIISYCGLFAFSENKKILSSPDILLVHSVDDNIIPYEKAIKAKLALETLDLNVSLHTFQKIRHNISKEAWKLAPDFLND